MTASRRAIGIATTGLWAVWFCVTVVAQFHFHAIEHRWDADTGQLVHMHHAEAAPHGDAEHGCGCQHGAAKHDGEPHGATRWLRASTPDHPTEDHTCPFVSAALHAQATDVAPPDTDRDATFVPLRTTVHVVEIVHDLAPLTRAPKTSPPPIA